MSTPKVNAFAAFVLIQFAQLVVVSRAQTIYGFKYQSNRGKDAVIMSFPHSAAPNAPLGVYEYYYVPDNSDQPLMNEIEPNRANRSIATSVCEARGTNWTLLSLHSDQERDFILSQGTLQFLYIC
jgi:hypothetical protein